MDTFARRPGMAFQFGDILAVTPLDLAWPIYLGGAAVLGTLIYVWRPMLSLTVHEELARVEGVPIEGMRLAFVLLLAIAIAAAMKIVGVLLITSLLIIPAATARNFARSPEQMAVLASVIGALAVAAGLAALRWPSTRHPGPSVVAAAAVLFALIGGDGEDARPDGRVLSRADSQIAEVPIGADAHPQSHDPCASAPAESTHDESRLRGVAGASWAVSPIPSIRKCVHSSGTRCRRRTHIGSGASRRQRSKS